MSETSGYTFDTARAQLVASKRGHPPAPTIVTFNPKYDEWLEGAALVLCLEEEDHVGVVPTPCSKHLSEARQVANHLLTKITNGIGGEMTVADTCEFGRYDEAGNAIEECQRTDYQEVQMYDGDTVRICAKHRSWLPAMGLPAGGEIDEVR